jgi:hypothetical protein
VIADFGRRDTPVSILEENFRFHEGGEPSMGGSLFSESVDGAGIHFMYDNDTMPCDYNLSGDTELIGAGTPVNPKGREETCSIPSSTFGRKVVGFEDPDHEKVQESARTYGTQDSITKTPFPKVHVMLPLYF